MTKTEELRRQKGLSIRALALATGLSHSTISRIEKGQRKISTSQAVALSKFFEVPIEYLIGVGEDTMAKTQTKYPAKEIRFPNNRLKQLRESRGLSLRALSEKTGIDFATISFCEKGQRNFSANSIKVLSDFFDVSIDYMLGVEPHGGSHGMKRSVMGDRSKTMNATVGKRVKELRKAHGWTQVQLSEKLNKGDSTVRMWELGKSEPDNETIVLLSDFFGVSVDYLLGKSPEEMFNDFVDSLKRDFSVDTLHSDGEVTQSLDDSVREPVRTKIKILLMLREINDVDRLNTIYQTAKLQSAAEDFSTPAEED